ncbi:MAG: hypothetical protein WCI91_01850 [Candidatus Nomurabacteria bacterium]
MNKDLLKKIIEYGIQAPSGDNSQPWNFVITEDDKINIYNIPDRDNPILNVHEGGSMVSHGAVITNIRIVSDHFGYKAKIKYFPSDLESNLVVEISFEKNDIENYLYKPSLFDSIYKRCTNRNFYQKDLPESIMEDINKIQGDDGINFRFFFKNEEKDFISSKICLSEEIILQTEELHSLLFADVAWTKNEELKKRHGLYVKTLEFNPVQLFVFWLCRKWKNISFLNKKIGFAHIVGKQNSDIYKSSGLLGFIIIKNTEKETYVKAGELLQYIWLKSTDLGLGFQPVTGLFFLNERIKVFGNDPISLENSNKITDAYDSLKDFAQIDKTDIILTTFRIGKTKESSGRSSRLKPNIIIK